MDNKLVKENKDIFQCPDTKEELLIVSRGEDDADFINKFETKFHIKDGFVDFVGHDSAGKVTGTKKKSTKKATFSDLYEKILKSDDLISQVFNSIVWGKKLDVENFKNAFKVFLTELQGGIVLDIPVINGLISSTVYPDFHKMKFVAADFSSENLASAFRKFKLNSVDNAILVQADSRKLPFRDNIFDGLSCLGGINFIRNCRKSFLEMNRVMKKGAKMTGIAFISGEKKWADIVINKLVVPKNIFHSLFTKDELQKSLDEAGFSKVTVTKFESDTIYQVTGIK